MRSASRERALPAICQSLHILLENVAFSAVSNMPGPPADVQLPAALGRDWSEHTYRFFRQNKDNGNYLAVVTLCFTLLWLVKWRQ